MTCQYRRCHTLDVFAATDVTQLVLALEFVGERAQAVLPAGEQDEAPAFPCERAGDRLADPTRGTGNYGYAVVIYRQTFT
jgi:hypothetical protein